MKKIFPHLGLPKGLRPAVVALGVLGAPAAFAQSSSVPVTPTTVYGLGYNVGTGATFILPLNPANLNNGNPLIQALPIAIDLTNVTPGQRLVAIDTRPSTGQIYALGYNYNLTTNNARLYTLTLNAAGNSFLVSPVSSNLLTLDLQDPTKGFAASPTVPVGTGNTLDFTTTPTPAAPQLYNVVFDFNPRADRIRVSGPRTSNGTSNGITYVLNPNTGAVGASSPVTGSFTDGQGNQVPYYLGTGAYTNSAFGVAGTTLYDLTINNGVGKVVTQNIATGALTRQADLTFATLGSAGYGSYTTLNSPTIRLDLDFYYDRGGNSGQRNIAYVLEARRNPNNNGYSSNLYTLDFSSGATTSGQATGKNIYGASDLSGAGASFIYDIAALSNSPKVWIGKSTTAPTAWNDNDNWYPMGRPTNTDDVLIPGNGTFVAFGSGYTVTTQPTVNTSNPANGTAAVSEALSVTLTNGALLTLADGGTLNIYGDFVNTDSQVSGGGSGTLALLNDPNMSTITHDLGGNVATTFPNLSVGAGIAATTSQAVSITQALTLSSNLTIGTGQLFTLLSNAAGTAYVVNNSTTNNFLNGNATVQRYIDASGNSGSSGYRQYSSPIARATVNSLTTTGQGGSFTAQVNPAYNTQDPNTLTVATYPNVFSYDETKIPGSPAVTFTNFDKGYQSPQSVNDPLIVGRSYTVQIGNTEKVQFTGQVNNGDQTIGGLTRTGNTDGSGWALVGNPYPSPLDWGTVTSGQLTNVDAAVYVFQSTEAYKGRFTSFTNGVGAGTGLIASSQGFLVRASGGTGSITLSNGNRAASSTTKFQRTAAETRPLLRLSLGLGSSPATIATAQDETFVYFEQGATAGFDGKFDAYKLANPSGYYLGTAATVAAGDQPTGLSIDGRNPLVATSATEVIAVQLSAPTGTYSLTATSLLNFASAGTQVYLRDALLGTLTNLATTPNYSFSIAANSASTGRFSLVFGSASALATAPSAALAQTLATLYPNPAAGADNVTLAVTGLPQDVRLVEATLVNALGQIVSRTTLAAAQGNARTNLTTSNLAGGVYLLRLSAQNAQGQVVGSLPAQRLSLH
ncbi:DUF4394 domain-containing protein [Hymenobacter sp. H14-R3]|uniref:DUF4394 domain-containing protein n=1 Tax=Hymenobacter sp. H14-R3 TaxID=3046308 RepID=UPI0024BB748B|nr:DUF4394 domain-containing protein [Hymenobacter sp. H14-R3]MDJ0366694.1 DUF4394 domain-containing protein [Hymenobacter sp. H14-R3]